jgi:hypothetical protein
MTASLIFISSLPVLDVFDPVREQVK